jgi:hypothetical protein
MNTDTIPCPPPEFDMMLAEEVRIRQHEASPYELYSEPFVVEYYEQTDDGEMLAGECDVIGRVRLDVKVETLEMLGYRVVWTPVLNWELVDAA